MAVSLSLESSSCKRKIPEIAGPGVQTLEALFRPRAPRRERILADVIQTLAWYAKHCPCPPRNSHDLKILLRVSVVLARVGRL
jgi:hypothetical protein